MTADKERVSLRGRCPCKQYIPSKSAKCGLKIWWNCDGDTLYPLKGEVLLERQPGEARRDGLGTRTLVDPSFAVDEVLSAIICSHPCHWLRNSCYNILQ